MGEDDMTWTVAARNTAPDSENKIHDDEVASRHGFAGGLVPGVTTYAWLARQALVALGPGWLEHGGLDARFVTPVYEGDRITVEARPTVPAGREAPADAHPGVAHPGWLLQFANWILAANVRLGPWIHTATTVTHYRTVRDGEQLEVRGRIADVYERKGHELVDLDLLYLADGAPVQRVQHTAIYRLRPA